MLRYRELVLAFLVVAPGGLTGCFTSVYSERVGRPQDPHTPSCALQFDYDSDAAHDVIVKQYPIQVGVLELAHIDGDDFRFTEEIKTKLQPAACKLGGDYVMYANWYEGSLATGKIGKFLVFQKGAKQLLTSSE